MTYMEFPKWIRHPGQPDVLVDNAEAEAVQLAAWAALAPKPKAAPAVNALTSPVVPQLDPDDGEPAGADLPGLRAAYKEKFGKRAFPGWNAAEITKRMGADA